ncbi:DUF721 domain-containing protein [Lentisphaerota bacterium ZTH]|nr:DUF721 domain-containing protein [Lentisphaerota bacterium]WET07282.1 DUF721 domain-containing protein [Lentisphaerota bacterium ZTH]
MGKNKEDFNTVLSLLNDWYGHERAGLEITAYCPETKWVGDEAERILKKTVSPDISDGIRIREGWKSIAGAQIAAISLPLNLQSKILTVEVKHSVWMRELNGPVKNTLIKKINKFAGKEVCKDIRCVPAGRSFK